jgi:hypothetical protein
VFLDKKAAVKSYGSFRIVFYMYSVAKDNHMSYGQDPSDRLLELSHLEQSIQDRRIRHIVFEKLKV